MLDPFEAHPPTQAPDVDQFCGFCLRPHSYDGGVALAEPNPITDRAMLRRSLDVRIPILPFYATSPMIQLWWPFVRTDNVLFHITILLSALSLERLKQQDEGRYSKKLLGKCVTRLWNRVQGPELSISDHTIVAIANLATIEMCQKLQQLCVLIPSMNVVALKIFNCTCRD